MIGQNVVNESLKCTVRLVGVLVVESGESDATGIVHHA